MSSSSSMILSVSSQDNDRDAIPYGVDFTHSKVNFTLILIQQSITRYRQILC